MLRNLINRLLAPASTTDRPTPLVEDERLAPENLPRWIEAEGVAPLDFPETLIVEHGLPVPDWDAVLEWCEQIPDAGERDGAWGEAEVAWLVHLRAALGAHYRLVRRGDAVVLSSLEAPVAVATAQFMNAAQQRVVRLLDGIAQAPEGGGHDILLVLDDEDTYYNYVARYYPDEGEFALSGGMFIKQGCGHFVTRKAELKDIESTIVHEITHGCLSHLRIPLWLNEGLAVNTEERLSPGQTGRHSARQRDALHQKFWNADTIQEFWTGHSFHRPDEGNMLSYDLARLLVRHLSAEGPRFVAFANAAQAADGGDDAARSALGVDLGKMVQALFRVEESGQRHWSPDPSRWISDRVEVSAAEFS